MRATMRAAAAGVALLASSVGVSACGSSNDTTAPTTTVVKSTENLVGKRYCEILLVSKGEASLQASVYTTFPLSDCPEAAWKALDTKAIATQQHAVAALANGPRFWLMDSIEKVRKTPKTSTVTFGGLEMKKEATVDITPADIAGSRAGFVAHSVNRTAAFVYNPGRTIYELTDDQGHHYVMQSWSRQIVPDLSQGDLVDLAPRLTLPAGWSYGSRVLSTTLVVQTEDHPATVLQDNLMNSYSMETAG
jgi:hypothetical protein